MWRQKLTEQKQTPVGDCKMWGASVRAASAPVKYSPGYYSGQFFRQDTFTHGL